MQAHREVKKIVRKYKMALKKDNFPVERIILYGSHAQGRAKPYSDIDVCVVSRKFSQKSKDRYETYLWKKVLVVDPRIEPVGYHPEGFNKEDPLAHEIKKYGIRI